MNNKHIVFLILAIVVIAFLWNKNEHIDSNIDNLTVTNINASGKINAKSYGPINSNEDITAGNITADGNIIGRGGNIIADKTSLVARRLNSAGNGQIQLAISPNIIAAQDTNGWSSQPLSIVSSNVSMSNNLDVNGIVSAKKFISTDGSSSGPLSNEAIQSIASVYNKDNLTATNINATGTINASNYGPIISPGASLGDIRIGKSVKAGSPNWGDINWGDGTGWKLNMGQSGNPTMQVYDNGSVQIGKANDRPLSIGASALGGSPNWSDISWGDGTGWRLNMGKSGAPTMQVYDNGTVKVNGTVDADKIFTNGAFASPIFAIRTGRDWKEFGNAAARKFKRSEPDLTVKQFVFLMTNDTVSYSHSYVKLGNKIQMIIPNWDGQPVHKDANWIFDIPN